MTALALKEAMRRRRQWMIQLSDDVFAISIGATKIMFCENSLTLQRWVASFHGVYLRGSTLFSHRNMSQPATLYEALLQSGQLFTTTAAINGNARGQRGAPGLELAREPPGGLARDPLPP